MPGPLTARHFLIGAASLLVTALGANAALPLPSAPLCTLLPGRTLALLRVEKDTTLPFVPTGLQPLSMTGVRGPADSLLATPGAPMPAGRVRLLQLDSTTRSELAAHGVSDREPMAFVRAAP